MMIKVHVSKGQGEIQFKDGIYFVYTKEPTENNRANIDVIKQLSHYFNKDSRNIKLLKGSKSRTKIFEIN